jgi:signal transduction histidine kinase
MATWKMMGCRRPLSLMAVVLGSAGLLSSATVDGNRELLLLGNHDLPPMIYLTDNGPKGIVVDLANAIIERSGLHARVDAIDWGTAQERLKNGTADALLQINSNPERAKIFQFTGPLLNSELSIFRRADRIDIRDITSLYGHRVGVEKRGYPASILARHPDIDMVIIPSWDYGLRQVSRGEIDAVAVDRWVGEFELSRLGISDVVVNESAIDNSFSAIAVRKGDDALLAALDQALADIRADGTYDRILANWQGAEVIHLTRQQRFFYVVGFISTLLVVILLAGLVYVRKIRTENALKSVLNSALEKRNDELVQFAYSTSHDLKSPLVSSRRLLEFIEKDMDAGDLVEAKCNIAVVSGQLGRLEVLVGDILDLTAADFHDYDRVSLDVEALFSSVRSMNAAALEESRVDLQMQSQVATSPQVPQQRLTQVLTNLVSNGIKYRDDHKPTPRVDVTLQLEHGQLLMRVQDNGRGVPAGHEDRLYDRFSRLHPDVATGSGLGLSIVRKHVDAMGGSIDVSTEESVGTTFTVRIPI